MTLNKEMTLGELLELLDPENGDDVSDAKDALNHILLAASKYFDAVSETAISDAMTLAWIVSKFGLVDVSKVNNILEHIGILAGSVLDGAPEVLEISRVRLEAIRLLCEPSALLLDMQPDLQTE